MKKILLVEDDSSLSYGIEIALKGAEYDCSTANNIESAKIFLQENVVDMVILDVMLPDGKGYNLLELIRKTSDMPAIFLSALSDDINVITGLNVGADDYITKPFNVGELLSRINALFRRVGKTKTSQIISGNIKLDIINHKVIKKNNTIPISMTEYKIILCLIENSQNIVTKQKILQKVWDIDGNFVDENTLSVNIRRIRAKIEDNPTQPEYIKTVRGVGYVWNKECEKP